MSRILCLFVVLLFCISLCAQERNWSDSSGKFNVDAELVGVKNQSAVLRKPDGEQILVPLQRLSKKDQQFVSQWQKNQKKKPADEADAKGGDWTADVKTKATAKRELGFDNDVNNKDPMSQVAVIVNVYGRAAAKAVEFGKLKIETFQDGKGNDLIMEGGQFGPDLTNEMDKIQKRGEDFFPPHPIGGFQFQIKFFDKAGAVKKISRVSGQIDVLTGGTAKVVTIKDVSTHEKGAIDSEVLQEIGVTCEFDRTANQVKLKMVGDATLAAVKFVNSKGKPIEPDGWSSGGWKDNWEYAYDFKKIPAADLLIEFRVDPVTVTLPFEAKNVSIKAR